VTPDILSLTSDVVNNSKNEKIDQLSMLTSENLIIENQRLMWSLVRMPKTGTL